MERAHSLSSEPTTGKKSSVQTVSVKLIEWEDYEQEVARLWSLSSALTEARERKEALQGKIHSLIQVDAESLSRLNVLEEIRERVESRKKVMESLSVRSQGAAEKPKKEEARLGAEVRSLLVAGTALSAANKQLEVIFKDANDLGEFKWSSDVAWSACQKTTLKNVSQVVLNYRETSESIVIPVALFKPV
ncbi:Vacuolar protein sorting 38 [Linum grandiflorum]